MPLVVTKDFLNEMKEKYGNDTAVSGYAEQSKLLSIPMPKFYIVVLDETNLTLVQLNFKLEEKVATVIPIESIDSFNLSGLYMKKVVFKTGDQTYKLVIRPTLIGIKEHQTVLIRKLEMLNR
ncbi:hypothetical protein [Marinilactibacillus sp. Marseille-P9653]|uniref:hypothetical protein n=1 Tax=Marinilactibacillus sp. Marseille-P9653 TaxID=2866583 RepID=UPI001CE3F578|nr:hypothetical protein [Marinilactibacillus sp. Marseille-P9653]